VLSFPICPLLLQKKKTRRPVVEPPCAPPKVSNGIKREEMLAFPTLAQNSLAPRRNWVLGKSPLFFPHRVPWPPPRPPVPSTSWNGPPLLFGPRTQTPGEWKADSLPTDVQGVGPQPCRRDAQERG